MGWRACCGLWAGKDDEDNDYYDDSEFALPKPKSTVEHVEHLKSQSEGMVSIPALDHSSLSVQAPEPVSLGSMSKLQHGRHNPSNSDLTVSTASTGRSVEKVGWEISGASASSTPSRPQQQSFSTPAGRESHVGAAPGASSTTASTEMLGAKARNTTLYSAAPPSRKVNGYDAGTNTGEGSITAPTAGHRRRPSGSEANVANAGKTRAATARVRAAHSNSRPVAGEGGGARLPRGVVLPRVGSEAMGGSLVSGSGDIPARLSALPPTASGAPKTHRNSGACSGDSYHEVQKSKFDLVGFVAKLNRGVLLTKINRQGKAKVRTLFYDEDNKLLWWSEPGAAARGNTPRPRSGSLLSRRREQPLPVATLLKVRKASQLEEPFCFEEDVDKSFQLVFPQRTVDLVAKDEEEATLLATGFQELKASVV